MAFYMKNIFYKNIIRKLTTYLSAEFTIVYKIKIGRDYNRPFEHLLSSGRVNNHSNKSQKFRVKTKQKSNIKNNLHYTII